MFAEIEKAENGCTAIFKRLLPHTVQEVWAALTENDKLVKWFSNLQVTDLRKDGTIKFHMNDGSGKSIDMRITDYEKGSVLEYEWGEGSVRFELSPQSEECLLVLSDIFPTTTDHTAKDIAGWHICLDVFTALLDGVSMEFPMEEWQKVYEQYKVEVDRVKI
ncbi:activator of Hsp90 ATPase 1 family protein [Heyndrickxia shackletonii]|uniref:Activator of Hsp90 ATPase 1 family protein n=1 Tax=Heyndrickxia shackletonii TaxID=157838 RepID=A0A0Q3TL21_9BACI|nr:SRPBCC family protein [Heyndrickxia shackletonii]KQL54329.1 activator of Hsp90 ATPase 1 family protein [Heyndrickxia shackletonii]MBB2480190.1 SRPBCC family protein [Bacillus sp. APMAM]NEZ01447.1 SRPBCC family protein [Heyndrickxia shackletonii]RTZ56395.1 SRPBCC family protein [Bacillus sp. SAJ1]